MSSDSARVQPAQSKSIVAQRGLIAAAGSLLAAMIALAILHGLTGTFPSWPAGLCAWVAGALLVHRVKRTQQVLLIILLVLGALAMIFALSRGVSPEWVHLLDENVPLVAMIAAVGFLRLVAGQVDGGEMDDPAGRKAFRHTMFSVAVLGSFINISAPILVADRLAVKGRVTRLTSQSITRVFSGCSAWSPFFGGMAVVLTYVSDARLLPVMLAGLPFALISLVLVITEAQTRYRDQLAGFKGYPITVASLWIPAVLAAAVALGSWALPGVSILYVIAIAALGVTVFVLIHRQGPKGSARTLGIHVRSGLPGMAGELMLFLGAGVLAVGLSAVVETGVLKMPVTEFTPAVASVLLLGVVTVSAVGLHPVISVAAMTPLLLPLDPSPTLLAVTYLYCWSLGTCASPLSGTHLIFQGRYGVPSYKAAVWNWPYVIVMFFFGVLLLHTLPI
ncbi:MAG: hypothetical protein AB8C46_10535 [Burkholderiaceae bacterium]